MQPSVPQRVSIRFGRFFRIRYYPVFGSLFTGFLFIIGCRRIVVTDLPVGRALQTVDDFHALLLGFWDGNTPLAHVYSWTRP